MGWWFGRKQAAPDARPFVPGWLSMDTPGEGFASDYATQVDEVFRRNPVGQRAVRVISGMLGGLTIDAIEGDKLAAKLVGADGLLEGIAASLLLQGNAYVQLIADDRDRPQELMQLRPERVQVVADDRGWPIAYAVPREIDQVIDETLVAMSPIRSIANVVKVGSAGYRKLIASGGTPSGWVAYDAARPVTNTPTFTEVVPAAGDLYANPAATRSRCSTMRCSTSRLGWRTRSRSSSRGRRARRSSPAPASTNRSAS